MVISWESNMCGAYEKGIIIKKYIYKITNIKNGKIYIGQTKDIDRRIKEHLYYKTSSCENLLKEVEKYGRDSFEVQILEQPTEFYNEKEIYYISKYREEGYELYNIANGGENPPTWIGFEHPCCTLNQKQVMMIKDLLSNTYFTNTEIIEMCDCTDDQINHINRGNTWREENIEYPLRKTNWNKWIGDKIICDLQTTNLTQKEISKKYNVARSMVTMINNGFNQRRENIDYPIRKGRVKK